LPMGPGGPAISVHRLHSVPPGIARQRRNNRPSAATRPAAIPTMGDVGATSLEC
jgi:hypothetical protein